MELTQEVNQENMQYYEQKARELAKKQKSNKLFEIQLRLLIKALPELSLNKEINA